MDGNIGFWVFVFFVDVGFNLEFLDELVEVLF